MRNSKKRIEEPSRHMEDIWREHHDPETQERRKQRIKKERRLKETEEDLGL